MSETNTCSPAGRARRGVWLAVCAGVLAVLGLDAGAVELRVSDLVLTLDSQARVTRISAAGAPLRTQAAPFVEACVSGTKRYVPLRPLSGGKSDVWRLRADAARLTVEIEPRMQEQALHFQCRVVGDPGPARGVLLRFNLPFDAVGWRWHDDTETAVEIGPNMRYENIRPLRAWPDLPEWKDKPDLRIGYSNRNYCTVVTGPKAGLCLAVPLDRPCIFRTAYDARRRSLELVYDFALTADSAQPYRAEFAFDLFTCDPAWGFRSALARYYRLYPEFFRVYVKRPGQWMAFTRLSGIDNANEFGFGLQEGAPEPEYDDKIGVLSCVYFTHAGMFARIPGYDPERESLPPYEKQLEAMEAAFERRTHVPDMYRSVGLFTPDGRFDIRKTRVYGHIIAQFNLDPDLPYGAWTLKRAVERTRLVLEKRGARLDGFYYDGLSSGLNYRREHFKSASFPCLWDPVNRKPALNNFFSSCEFARAAAELLRPRGQITMMNGALGASFFVAPWLDVFGAETGLRIPRERFNYIRTVIYHKPFLTLLKGNYEQKIGRAEVELFMKRCLAYGVFPGFFDWPPSGLGPGGRYWDHAKYYERDRDLHRKYVPLCRTLALAGWEPVTHARCSDPGLLIERFGPRDGVLWLTVLNDGGEATDSVVTVDLKALGLASGRVQAVDVLSGEWLPVRPQGDGGVRLDLRIRGRDVRCLCISAPEAYARVQASRVLEVLESGRRMREVDADKPAVAVHWRPLPGQVYGRGAAPGGGKCLVFSSDQGARVAAKQWVMLFQNAAEPLTLRVRASARGLKGGRAGVRCRLAWTTPQFTHYETRFRQVPEGTYDWRDLEFRIESPHALRAVELVPGLHGGARGELRIARISLVSASGQEYVVDPDLHQWYEPVPVELRPSIDAAWDRLEVVVQRVRTRAGEPDALRKVVLEGLSTVWRLRRKIVEAGAANGCRRVLRDLAEIETCLARTAPYAWGFIPPRIDCPTSVAAGEELEVRFPRPGSPAAPVQTELYCNGERVKLRDGRAVVRIPGDAKGGDTLTITGVYSVQTSETPIRLETRRSVVVVEPFSVNAFLRTQDVTTGVCSVCVEITNHRRRPLTATVSVDGPAGWKAGPPAAVQLAPGARRRVAPALTPPPGAAGGRVAARASVAAGERRTEKTVRFVFVPPETNRLRNGGFENGMAGWSVSGRGEVRNVAEAASGRGAVALRNASRMDTAVIQSVELKQKTPCPIAVRASSRAAGVTGPPGRGYSLYVDIYYTDGTPSYGHVWEFPTGESDWQSGEVLFEPEKPIDRVNVYLLLRGKRGTAFFDDVAVMEDAARRGNLARSARVNVDSYYKGYTPAPINDGRVYVDDLHWSRQAWASEDNNKPHFIEFDLGAPVRISRLTVWWARDSGRLWTSRKVLVQVWADGGWKTIAGIDESRSVERSTVRFEPIAAQRVRLLQPSGMGPEARPGIMWIREVELFSTAVE